MRPGSILLIEPDDDSRAMYDEYLRSCGFKVLTADTTNAGFGLAAAADVVVTGIRVPGSFDGLELVRRLRRDARTRQRPIIVLTACAFEPDEQRARLAGCDAFLPKPCLPDLLASEIRRVFKLRLVHQHQPAPARPAKHSKHRAS